MPNLVHLDRKIQWGRGKAARKAGGQPFNVYRNGANVSGGIISGAPVYRDFLIRIERAKKTQIENQSFELLIYEATCNNERLRKQDLLVQVGYEGDGGTWLVAQIRPAQETLLARVETTCSITRTNTDAGAASQQPEEGVTVQPGYGATRLAIEKNLILTNGLYSFSTTATKGASIPCGIQPLNRVRDGNLPKGSPTRQAKTHHLIAVPLLPGIILDVDDVINADAGDRYKIKEVHNTGLVGLALQVCIGDREWV